MGTEGKEERLPTRRRVEERNAAARRRANGSTGGGGTCAGARRWADTRREVPKPAGANGQTPQGRVGGQASVDLQALGAANWDDWGGLARRARFQGAQLGGAAEGALRRPFFSLLLFPECSILPSPCAPRPSSLWLLFFPFVSLPVASKPSAIVSSPAPVATVAARRRRRSMYRGLARPATSDHGRGTSTGAGVP
jgi:hypothetical protein